jgi:hypothetical protein
MFEPARLPSLIRKQVTESDARHTPLGDFDDVALSWHWSWVKEDVRACSTLYKLGAGSTSLVQQRPSVRTLPFRPDLRTRHSRQIVPRERRQCT